MPETPKTGLGSPGCEWANKQTEYTQELARSRFAWKRREKGVRWASEERGPRPEGGPAEIFRRQCLECSIFDSMGGS